MDGWTTAALLVPHSRRTESERSGSIPCVSFSPARRRRWLRLLAPALVAAFALAAVFAVMHAGAQGAAVCHREGFEGPGTLSLWPPGARCVGGEPERVRVLVSSAFWLLGPAVVFAGACLWQLARFGRAASPASPD